MVTTLMTPKPCWFEDKIKTNSKEMEEIRRKDIKITVKPTVT